MPKPPLFNYKVFRNVHTKEPYHWVCVASNGEVRYTSEKYTQKHNAINAIITDIKYRVKGVCSFEDCTGETRKIPKRVERAIK
jgi:uncharacterized protein YegP (UPF0339 family)